MKKIFILTTFYAFSATFSFGQTNLGYKLGLNVSRVRNSSHNDFTSNLGFNTGILAKFKLDKNNLIKTELLLSLKGFHSILIPIGTTTTNFTYLTLPVLYESRVFHKLYFQAGPELNYLIVAKSKNSTFKESVMDSYKRVDITFAGGLSSNISKNLSIETRYILGLTQINKRPDIFGSEHNRTFQFNLIFWIK